MARTLEEIEDEISEQAQEQLREPRKLLEATFNLLGTSVSSLPKTEFAKRNSSARVAVLLLIRMANDLRCVSLLTKMGYAPQAATLASSIYEIGYTVGFIGADNALADKWIDHEEVLTTPFGNLLKVTQSALSNIGVQNPKEQALAEYRIYTQFCMAKHGNPLFQGQHGYAVVNGRIAPRNGPDASEQSIRVSWFALEKAVGVALVAGQSFILNHVPADNRQDLQAKLNALGKECVRVRSLAVQRWGKEDPSPDKWKK